MGPWLLLLAAGAVIVGSQLGADDTLTLGKAFVTGGCKGAPQLALARQLASIYGPIFGAPVETLLAICKIESGFRPDCVELSPRAMTRAGAWGLMQQTLTTAKGNVVALRNHPSAQVQQAIAKFDGSGTSLLDPDLCMCLGAYQLGTLTKQFGDFVTVAAAYHQGAGKIRGMLGKGLAINASTLLASGAPLGAQYVTRALAARESLA